MATKMNSQSLSKISGKIALITGASSGIGLAAAKLFVAEGAHVFITGRRQSELNKAQDQLGSNSTAVQGDISNLRDLDNLFRVIREKKERLDVLFANAGMGEPAPLGAITELSFDKIFAVNVRGTFFTVQKALPLMPQGSTIILNASMAGSKGLPALSVYAASKAAVRSFARTWAVDLRERKIRVNAISAGVIRTSGYEAAGLTKAQYDQFVQGAIPSIPVGRAGTVEEVAKAVLFLASDDSSYVNGIELFVDGGMGQI
jgi:NAD(P)-dependent dehydrogenase (short-subunit alcohol dehydrogenase family)